MKRSGSQNLLTILCIAYPFLHRSRANDPCSAKKQRVHDSRSLEAALLGEMEKRDEALEGTWNGSRSREYREDNNVRRVRFVPAADLLFYPVKRCHPGPGKNLILRRKGQRRLIYCIARVTLVFITKWINRSVPRCYDIRRATFDQ